MNVHYLTVCRCGRGGGGGGGRGRGECPLSNCVYQRYDYASEYMYVLVHAGPLVCVNMHGCVCMVAYAWSLHRVTCCLILLIFRL